MDGTAPRPEIPRLRSHNVARAFPDDVDPPQRSGPVEPDDGSLRAPVQEAGVVERPRRGGEHDVVRDVEVGGLDPHRPIASCTKPAGRALTVTTPLPWSSHCGPSPVHHASGYRQWVGTFGSSARERAVGTKRVAREAAEPSAAPASGASAHRRPCQDRAVTGTALHSRHTARRRRPRPRRGRSGGPAHASAAADQRPQRRSG